MTILRSLLTPAAFVLTLHLVAVGCSENASNSGANGNPASSAEAEGKGSSGGSAASDASNSNTTTSGADSGSGNGGTSATDNGNSNSAKSTGGATASEKSTNTGGAIGSEKPTNTGGTIGSEKPTDTGGTKSTKGGTSTKSSTATSGAGGQGSATSAAKGGGSSSSNTSPASGGTTGGSGAGKGLTIYYIRHGEVVANTVPADQITMENADTLTDLGLRQIEALTKYLQGLGTKPDAIIVSPAKRAQKTIEPYLVAEGAQGEVWLELMECCTAAPTGAALPTAPEYISYYKATIEGENLAFRDPAAIKYWKTDTFEQGLFMVMTAKELLLSRYSQSGKTIFVLGHASAGQIMIGLLLGEDMTKGAATTGKNAVFLLNTGVMQLSQDPATGAFKLVGKNVNNPVTK